MKKGFKIIAIMCVIILALTACGDKKKNENVQNIVNNNSQAIVDVEKNDEPVIENPISESDELKKMFINIEEISGLDETTKLTKENIKEKFEFGEHQNLEMQIHSKETNETISEVAIVKLDDSAQTDEIFVAFAKRREALQEKYSENEKVLEIINSSDNVMKQEGGTVVFIIAENAKEIEEYLSKASE